MKTYLFVILSKIASVSDETYSQYSVAAQIWHVVMLLSSGQQNLLRLADVVAIVTTLPSLSISML